MQMKNHELSQMHNISFYNFRWGSRPGAFVHANSDEEEALVSFSVEAFISFRSDLNPSLFFLSAEMEMFLHMCRWGVIILADMGKFFNGVLT